MRSWWKSLGMFASGLASLGILVSAAHAQFPPSGGGMMGSPGMPPGMMMGGGGPPPGAFGGNPSMAGFPADFPNAGVPSKEPASPFSIKDEGMPNAFSELIDPRCRVPEHQCFVIRGEYIGWWIKKGPIRVDLATTNTNPTQEIGALTQPNTIILVPANDTGVDYQMLRGFRLSAGLAIGYLPPIEASWFLIQKNQTVFAAGSDGSGPLLAQPVQVINAAVAPNAFLETALVINLPGILNGNMNIVSRMSFWNVDVNAFFNIIETDSFKTDVLVGYRHTDLYEALEITSRSGGITGQVFFNGALQAPGFANTIFDSFRVRNAFDGGQIGTRTIFNMGRLLFFTDLKLAMGSTNSTLTIDGSTTLSQPVPSGRPSQTLQGGLLALSSNIGTTNRREFSVVSEGTFSLGYQATQNVRIFGGYNILYWSSVARPGDHLNSVIDARGVPSANIFNPNTAIAPARPPIELRDFWAHGFTVGIEIGF